MCVLAFNAPSRPDNISIIDPLNKPIKRTTLLFNRPIADTDTHFAQHIHIVCPPFCAQIGSGAHCDVLSVPNNTRLATTTTTTIAKVTNLSAFFAVGVFRCVRCDYRAEPLGACFCLPTRSTQRISSALARRVFFFAMCVRFLFCSV